MRLQNYKDGEIHRKGNNYYFKNAAGEFEGPYESVDALVAAQPEETIIETLDAIDELIESVEGEDVES